MLGYPKRPANHRPMRPGIGVSDFLYARGGDASLTFRILQRIGIDLASILIKSRRRSFNEFTILETCSDDFPANRISQGDVGADVETGPYLSPSSGTRPSRVDGIETRSMTDTL